MSIMTIITSLLLLFGVVLAVVCTTALHTSVQTMREAWAAADASAAAVQILEAV